MGGDLPRSLFTVLHAGAHEDAPASRGGYKRADAQPPQVIGVVRDYGTSRKRPPAPERCSPLEHPSERRPGLPRERVWVFWPRFVWETLYKHVILAGVIARLLVARISIACD